MASITDLITATESGGPPQPTTVTALRSPGATTLAVGALTNWPYNDAINANSAVHFVSGTPTTDAEGNSIIKQSTLCLWKGVIAGAGSTQITNIVLRYSATGSDPGNSIGDIVEMAPTSSWAQDLFEALTFGHNTEGEHTSPLLVLQPGAGQASAVQADGIDTNIPINLVPKGTGSVEANGNNVWFYLGSAQLTASVSSTSGSPAAVAGLSVGVTIPANIKQVKVTLFGRDTWVSTAGNSFVGIYRGATSGALTNRIADMCVNSTTTVPCTVIGLDVPTAGTVFYTVAMWTPYTINIDANPGEPITLLVEGC